MLFGTLFLQWVFLMTFICKSLQYSFPQVNASSRRSKFPLENDNQHPLTPDIMGKAFSEFTLGIVARFRELDLKLSKGKDVTVLMLGGSLRSFVQSRICFSHPWGVFWASRPFQQTPREAREEKVGRQWFVDPPWESQNGSQIDTNQTRWKIAGVLAITLSNDLAGQNG